MTRLGRLGCHLSLQLSTSSTYSCLLTCRESRGVFSPGHSSTYSLVSKRPKCIMGLEIYHSIHEVSKGPLKDPRLEKPSAHQPL
ncbi:hypothetical protein M422DRAFT_239779 [Sphaerobolus stellatus SS14]|nr:hypothetical protein M422DRAFT_239779 [Sphaerobolus stellatus SS14]